MTATERHLQDCLTKTRDAFCEAMRDLMLHYGTRYPFAGKPTRATVKHHARLAVTAWGGPR